MATQEVLYYSLQHPTLRPGLLDLETGELSLYELDETGLYAFGHPIQPEWHMTMVKFEIPEQMSGPEARRIRAFVRRDRAQPDIPKWFHGSPVCIDTRAAKSTRVRKFGRRWSSFFHKEVEPGKFVWRIHPLNVPDELSVSVLGKLLTEREPSKRWNIITGGVTS